MRTYRCKSNWKFWRSALTRCLHKGNYDGSLVKGGSDINALGEHQYCPLHYAVSQSHKEVAKFLIENGAARDGRNEFGETALEIAQRNKNPELVELLSAPV